jgi:signal transduction histidine kinase/ActR/RegA family two-component response regulator
MRLAQSMARVAAWHGVPLDGTFALTEGGERIDPRLPALSRWSELVELVHPEDRSRLQLAWRRGRGGGRLDVEFRLLIEGRQIDVHAMAEFEITGLRRTLRAAGMMQDVSEMRQAQRQLDGHRERLEKEVIARTAELVDARNEAERHARAKSEFLATMSHEIRTPLNAVLGLAQIGMQQSHKRRIADTFAQILESGGHLLNVVNDVLDHSKLEAGKVVIESRPFELRRVVRQCVEMLGLRVRGKGLDLPLLFSADLPVWVEGDAFRLQQILINLLGNAVKFTEQGEVRVEVSSQRDRVCFRVSDTGVGMTRAQMAQLFTPFHQMAESSDHRLQGTGLGLSISNTLARMMGGDIRVESEPGGGSRFELRLPLAAVATAETDDQDDTILAGQCGPRLQGLRVLLADDVAINRTVVEGLLEVEGADVRSVVDGQAAVAALAGDADAYDVVLMDVHMPVLDGRAATRRLRAQGVTMPVIGVTAHASVEEREESLCAGMDEQLIKPILREELVTTLLRLCRREVRVSPSSSAAGKGPDLSRGLIVGEVPATLL